MARRPLNIPISKQKKAELPARDSQGRKLPQISKGVPTGSSAIKSNKPTGKEVRVVVKDPGTKPQFATFRDFKLARDFINSSNAPFRIGREVRLEFGNGKKQRLKLGQKV